MKNILRKIREHTDGWVTQKDIGDELGISQPAVAKHEAKHEMMITLGDIVDWSVIRFDHNVRITITITPSDDDPFTHEVWVPH